ncbi:Mitochondrial import inner membrane translocase subunit Tim9 [Vitis vinifera]|uniref:Mitochondrial import inner membrane translocase subunit Tim9 n=1 Tax=Vitis vinifera TaxID=29760 RepID=A0A438G0T4_VITVI|nr:Mitochondrial import inner membrane translocase subunit Tim9 [Vitis vinifera]
MDKSMLGDLDSLPEEDKLRMSVMIDQLQIRDSQNNVLLKTSATCVAIGRFGNNTPIENYFEDKIEGKKPVAVTMMDSKMFISSVSLFTWMPVWFLRTEARGSSENDLSLFMPENLERKKTVESLRGLRMYNSLVERCFSDCVESFRRKSLDKQEETCVRRCAEKFLKHSMRVGMRFAELNQGTATPD